MGNCLLDANGQVRIGCLAGQGIFIDGGRDSFYPGFPF